MRVESLAELEAVFKAWRRRKRHVREAVPEQLRERARRAMRVHGAGPVARATKMERKRLDQDRSGSTVAKTKGTVAAYSRVELAAPGTVGRPFFEVETPEGVKVRIFVQDEQTVGFLASLCGMGGA